MQKFDYCNPTKIIFGKGTIGRIGSEIKAFGPKKVLLIAGGGSIKANGVYDQIVRSLQESGIEWVEAWGVQANPVLSKVREMIAQASRSGVDGILAVGGGSVIDSGKSVAAGVHAGDVWELYEKRFVNVPALPLFTVLTISASGSEFDPFAVLTNEGEKKKWLLACPSLFPKVSIIDPSVQASLPWSQIVNGAVDAIAHIMEAYVTAEDANSTEVTLALDESLMRTVIAMTDRLQKSRDDYYAQASLAWAASLALSGIQNAGVCFGDFASHGIEHGISAINPKIAHGAGLGVVLPAWIAYCHHIKPDLFKRWAKNVWNADNAEEGVKAFREKIHSWGNAVTLRELGVLEEQIPAIAANAVEFGLTGMVKVLSDEDIRAILRLA